MLFPVVAIPINILTESDKITASLEYTSQSDFLIQCLKISSKFSMREYFVLMLDVSEVSVRCMSFRRDRTEASTDVTRCVLLPHTSALSS